MTPRHTTRLTTRLDPLALVPRDYDPIGGRITIFGKKPEYIPYLGVLVDLKLVDDSVEKYVGTIEGLPLVNLMKAIAKAMGYEVRKKK